MRKTIFRESHGSSGRLGRTEVFVLTKFVAVVQALDLQALNVHFLYFLACKLHAGA